MQNTEFQERLAPYYDELKWLYCELYENKMPVLEQLCKRMEVWYQERKDSLKQLDQYRMANPQWYKGNKLLGMMMYVDAFGGNLEGVRSRLDYLEACGVNCLHLMPLLDTPEGRSDGGYAVSDFAKVKPELGTMEDLERLASDCHQKGISICLDFVMNHTSEDHEWAQRAKGGEKEYQDRYFFFDDYTVPSWYEKTVPDVFPTTAPGNFTYNPETGKYVMTTFYPYQWDLNYHNPVVLLEMITNMIYLINKGIDIIRIDAVPYIWKELGTNCRNLPRVHNIVRIMRIVCEVVCPGVLLLGEVVMEPDKVVPYFGSVDKPECHMLYNVTTMATTWNTVAVRDVRLLRRQLDIVNGLPKEYVFLNYLRCHDDIGWGLDYPTLRWWGMEEVPHKKFLNDYFTGKVPGSVSRGELYNEDLATGDARFCGTTASMCGIESAGFEQNEEKMEAAIRLDVMLHAYMLMQSGIPMIYSGDEIGQVNDYTYKEDPAKAEDSRYIHRGKFRWELAENCKDSATVQGKMFQSLNKLGQIRKQERAFEGDGDVWTADTGDDAILCIMRRKREELVIGLFNFHDYQRTAWISQEGLYRNLLDGTTMELKHAALPGHGFLLVKKV